MAPIFQPAPDNLLGSDAAAGNFGATLRQTRARDASRLPGPLVNRLHQVLKVGKEVGVGFVAVLGNHLPIDDYVELAMGSGG